MAVVSPVPTLPQQIERMRLHDIATSGMMESGGEIEEEPVCISEDKIFVAVGNNLKENKLTLLWALQNFGGKQICLLHIHQREQALKNFPLCTIELNEARVNVPDERFEWFCQLFKPKSEVQFVARKDLRPGQLRSMIQTLTNWLLATMQ